MADETLTRFRYSAWDVEADTVIGRRGGKCLFTIVFCRSEFFIARLMKKKTQECVIGELDKLERIFKRYQYPPNSKDKDFAWWFFNTFLTDNGGEMNDFLSMERTCLKGGHAGMHRMAVFYCDPYSSWQKPRIEVAHTLLRRVLPKGTSFEDLTQADIDLICSHINSYSRKNLEGASPFQMAPSEFGDKLGKALGLEHIKPDDVNLTPGLLTR